MQEIVKGIWLVMVAFVFGGWVGHCEAQEHQEHQVAEDLCVQQAIEKFRECRPPDP